MALSQPLVGCQLSAQPILTQPPSGKLSGIRSESVNYIGYYSAHEETMKSVIAEQARAGEERSAQMDYMHSRTQCTQCTQAHMHTCTPLYLQGGWSSEGCHGGLQERSALAETETGEQHTQVNHLRPHLHLHISPATHFTCYPLSHLEFLELIELVHHHTLDKLDPQLHPLLKV